MEEYKREELLNDVVNIMCDFHNWGINNLSGEEYDSYMKIVNRLAGIADNINEKKIV